MSRALTVVATGVAVGIFLVAVAQLVPDIVTAAAFVLLIAVAMVAPIDMLTLPRRHGQRLGSVDVLWALGAIAFFPWASFAWLLFGRPIRRRELEQRAAAPTEVPIDA